MDAKRDPARNAAKGPIDLETLELLSPAEPRQRQVAQLESHKRASVMTKDFERQGTDLRVRSIILNTSPVSSEARRVK